MSTTTTAKPTPLGPLHIDRLAAGIRARGRTRGPDAWLDWQRLSDADKDFWRNDVRRALRFARIPYVGPQADVDLLDDEGDSR